MRMTLLVMPPVIPQVHDELHMSETQVGLLIGLPLAMLAVAAIPGSLLIARVGATLAVTLGMTIAAIGGAARAAAIDVWTLYAAAIVSGFGIAIMQPGMPTLVREWLPSRLALGTIGYSSGMLMGAMFPAVFTIAFILPAVGGSWRLDVVLWAIPALLIAPVFLLASPKIPEDVDKQAAGGGRWWPDWKNPVVWLLGFTFASNNSPYFVTSAFLGDYLATLGKPELLGAALGWLNGSQLVAMAVLFLTANRLQMRAWPFLVFGPTMLAAFLVMMIFVTSSLAIVAATAVIGIAAASPRGNRYRETDHLKACDVMGPHINGVEVQREREHYHRILRTRRNALNRRSDRSRYQPASSSRRSVSAVAPTPYLAELARRRHLTIAADLAGGRSIVLARTGPWP